MNDNVVTGEVLPPAKSSSIAEYNATEAGLAELREQFATVPDVTTKDGMERAKLGRRTCITLRTDLEAKRKALKAPLLEAGRTLDSEAERIRGEILAIELPYDEAIKAEEAKAEAAREKKRQAEAAARKAIEADLDAIRNLPVAYVTADAAMLRERIAALQADTLERFDEVYLPTAQQARDTALEALDRLLGVRVAADEEAERNRAERERLDAERAEQEQREQAAANERQRQANIDEHIGDLRDVPRRAMGSNSERLRDVIADFESMGLPVSHFGERVEEAAAVKEKALAELQAMLEATVETERVAAEQAERQRQLDEQAAAQRREAEEAEQARQAKAAQEEAERAEAARAQRRREQEEREQRWAQRVVVANARMTDEELDSVCTLLFVTDPCPLSEEQRTVLVDWLDNESRLHGFTDWVDAFHGLARRAGERA